MTEEEWLAGADPRRSIEWLFFEAPVSGRKLRLFAVSCCRPVVPRLRQFAPQAARLLASVESLVDGQIPPEILAKHLRELEEQSGERLEEYLRARAEGRVDADDPGDPMGAIGYISLGVAAALNSARHVEDCDAPGAGERRRAFFRNQETRAFGPILVYQAAAFARSVSGKKFLEAKAEEAGHQWHFLREIFGNPFRPVAFYPSWRTDAALALARQMYDSRDFGAMPILADALQDTGCEDASILGHCRGDGPHVRGCWVVDLVLNKA